MHYLRFILFVLLIAITGCGNRKSTTTKHWFKGNLHTHSYWSDGDEFPETIMDWYISNDYQFVALSDHNILAADDKWVVIPSDSIYQSAFNSYLDKYGSDWVIYHIDTLNQINVKLKTFEEYRTRFEVKGEFLIIQSEEISDRFNDKPLHLNATNIQNKISPQGGNSVAEVLQNNIDAVLKQRDELNIPMIPHVNHPNFGYAISYKDIIALRNERFFEVYNGHPSVHNTGDSIHISTEQMWDLINIAYVNNNQPLIYGLATDDSHNYHVKGSAWSNAGRGWIMVLAESLSPSALIEAMEEGYFYASTGIKLKDVKFEDNKLSVEVEKEADITYKISFIGCRKGQTETEIFMSDEGNKASFELTDDILFVRCKIVSSKLHKNPIEDLLYETAWTQPVQYLKFP